MIFLAFRPFFTVWLGMVKLTQATVNWILKQSGHDFFHDYYWILKQTGHDFFHEYYWILKQTGHDFFMITTGSLNSQDMISFMITTGSLNSLDMIRILKQWRHDLSGKHLCDGYCMDIMLCFCVNVNIHGFVKLQVFCPAKRQFLDK